MFLDVPYGAVVPPPQMVFLDAYSVQTVIHIMFGITELTNRSTSNARSSCRAECQQFPEQWSSPSPGSSSSPIKWIRANLLMLRLLWNVDLWQGRMKSKQINSHSRYISKRPLLLQSIMSSWNDSTLFIMFHLHKAAFFFPLFLLNISLLSGKKTTPTSGDYEEEDWGSIESIDVTSEPKIEICIGRRKLKKHFKVSLTFKISLFYAFPNFFSEMLVMDMVGEVITWSTKNFPPQIFQPNFFCLNCVSGSYLVKKGQNFRAKRP